MSRKPRAIRMTRLRTPLGPMVAGAVDEGVCLLEFADRRALESQIAGIRRRLAAEALRGSHRYLERLQVELNEYFAGRRREFEVPVVMPGTAFQRACWRWLVDLPYGVTATYTEQARALGCRGAERAVGRANGANRLALLVPCHRVIRKGGHLAGYGGGLWRKRYLIEHELGNP